MDYGTTATARRCGADGAACAALLASSKWLLHHHVGSRAAVHTYLRTAARHLGHTCLLVLPRAPRAALASAAGQLASQRLHAHGAAPDDAAAAAAAAVAAARALVTVGQLQQAGKLLELVGRAVGKLPAQLALACAELAAAEGEPSRAEELLLGFVAREDVDSVTAAQVNKPTGLGNLWHARTLSMLHRRG